MKALKILIGLVALPVLAACTDDERDYTPDVSVTFNPAVVANSRAAGGVYPQDVPFGVWAYAIAGDGEWTGDVSQARLVMDDSKVECNAGVWSPVVPYVWEHGTNLAFFAYSPYECNATFTEDGGITFPDFDATGDTDLMFTYPVTAAHGLAGAGCVSLPFVHALAKVEFNVRAVAHSDSVIVLKSLSVGDVAYKGTFTSLPSGSWEPTADRMTLEFCTAPIELLAGTSPVGTHHVIGQAAQAPVRLVIDVCDKDGNVVVADRVLTSQPLNALWRVGKLYTYTLNVATDGITFTTDILEQI